MRYFFRYFFVETFLNEQEVFANNPQKSFAPKPILVILISTLSLVFIRYLGNIYETANFLYIIGAENTSLFLRSLPTNSGNSQLTELIYWACVSIIFYFIVPFCFIIVFNEKLSSFGVSSLLNIKKGYKFYFLFLLLMLPVVYLVSNNNAFLNKYPFYTMQIDEPTWTAFFVWQLFYFLQFAALEFFFRGFLLHGTKRIFGYYSIFVMVIPYCMIHFQKPFLETIGAIVAGVFLGTLSLKTKSIGTGILLHYSVAITMDLLALHHKGFI